MCPSTHYGYTALSAMYKLVTRHVHQQLRELFISRHGLRSRNNGRVEMHSLINIADEVSSHLKTVNLKMGHRSSTVTELTNKQECDK